MFTASTLTDPSVRDALIRGPWLKIGSNASIGAMFDHYNVSFASGAILDGTAG